MISIRLSAEEYESFRELCLAQGARSISDLARYAMQRLLVNNNGDGPDDILRTRVRELDIKVNFLDQEVERLNRLVGSARPEVVK